LYGRWRIGIVIRKGKGIWGVYRKPKTPLTKVYGEYIENVKPP
jgi:hypothetical protein